MKKFFISLILIGMYFPVTAQKYLVQSGVENAPQWRAVNAEANEELIDLQELELSLGAWYNTLPTPAGKEDEITIWVIEGTFVIGVPLVTKSHIHLYGGFNGTENEPEEREQGDAPWIFLNPTTLDADGQNCILNGPGSRSNVTVDGFTACNVVEGMAFKLRGSEQVQNCIIENNQNRAGGGKGGGVMFYGGGNLRNSLVRNNISGDGGGIAFLQVNSNKAVVENCIIESNTVSDGKGSAIHIDGSPNALIRNCLTYNNYGSVAIYVHSGVSGGGTLANMTVAETKTKGFYSNQQNITPYIYNSVFWGAADDGETICDLSNTSGGPLYVSHCAIVNYITETWDSPGTFHIEQEMEGDDESKRYPGFADPDNLDFTLTENSSLIDRGIVVENVTSETDFWGNPRVIGDAIDIGCFEYEPIEEPPVDPPVTIERNENKVATVKVYNKTLTITGVNETLKIAVYDVSGKLVEETVISGDYKLKLATGLFFVKIAKGSKVYTEKVLSL